MLRYRISRLVLISYPVFNAEETAIQKMKPNGLRWAIPLCVETLRR